MYLKYFQIVNYKNLKNARFEFGKGANTIIGENDSGKSNAVIIIVMNNLILSAQSTDQERNLTLKKAPYFYL